MMSELLAGLTDPAILFGHFTYFLLIVSMLMRRMVWLRAFAVASRLFSHLGGIGLLRPLARHGDRIGLSGEARAEKLRIFPLPGHNRAANAEVMLWMAAAGRMPRQRSTSHRAAWKSTPRTACSSLKPPPGPHCRQW